MVVLGLKRPLLRVSTDQLLHAVPSNELLLFLLSLIGKTDLRCLWALFLLFVSYPSILFWLSPMLRHSPAALQVFL